MNDLAPPYKFSAKSVGCVASRLLNGPVEGRVAALFESTFYIKVGPHLLCLGTKGMELGPLNMVTAPPSETDWRSTGIRQHMPAVILASEIRVGNQFAFPLSQTST